MTTTETIPPRPALRYHGGKYKLAPWIVSHFAPHRTYTEAFGGAASVLLHKSRSYAEVYNDLDGEVVNLFRVLRDPSQARELKRLIVLTPFARTEFEASYLPDGDPVEQARRTLFRSFAGFGSAAASGQATGFRNDATRSHTTPSRDWMNFPDALDFFTERLRGVVIEQMPALQLLRKFDTPQTLHYVDPPYVHATRSQKRRTNPAYRFELSDEEHAELIAALRELKGRVVVSGYACAVYDEGLRGWLRVEREALADGARPRVEVLWLNDAASAALESSKSQLRLI